MRASTKAATKLLIRSVRVTIVGTLGLIAIAIGGINNPMGLGISHAQDAQPGGKGQPGAKGQPGGKGQPGAKGQPGGGFGGMQGGLESVKSQIKATDEEWKVIGPKLREVIAARRAAEIGSGGDGQGSRGGFGGPGGGFGPPGGGGFGPPGGGPGGFGPPGGGPGGFGPGGGRGPGGGGQPPAGPVSPPSLLDGLNLTAEQKPQVETLQKEMEAKLGKILTAEQNKQFKDVRESRGGPGGFGIPPATGPILLPSLLDRLNLTAEQKPQIESLQKEVDTSLAKILTEAQNKQLKDVREAFSRIGPGQPPGFGGGGPPGFGGGGPPGFGGGGGGDSASNQALNELQAAIDDPKTNPTQLSEKVAAVRTARKRAREKLEVAQKELLLLITPEQEAVLVRLGYVD